MRRWEKVNSRFRDSYRVFSVREDRSRSPRTQQEHDFYVIEARDWVNVIPVTPEGRIVCVRQWRHGREEVTLEIPGGIIDAEDATPEIAGRREMVEETGFDTDHIVYLGQVAPNPAILNNLCHTVLALDVHPISEQAFDETEDLEVVLVDPADVPGMILRGEISHALVVAAFYLYDAWKQQPH